MDTERTPSEHEDDPSKSQGEEPGTEPSLYQSAQFVITKYHGLDGLNNRNLFITILTAGKSKIKVPARQVSF